MGAFRVLDLDPVAGGPFFLHLIVLGQVGYDAEPFASPCTDVELVGGHLAFFDKGHVHPGLATGWHGDLEPLGRLAFLRWINLHCGQHGHRIFLPELRDSLADQAGPGTNVDSISGHLAGFRGGDIGDDALR